MSVLGETTPKVADGRRIRVAILGCSGSIGTQTLDVCRRHADRLEVVAVSVNGSTPALVSAACEFGCSHAAVSDETHAKDGVLQNLPAGCRLLVGPDALCEIASLPEVDVVVNALVGFAGIYAGYEALKSKKVLAYANKESIVVGGDLLMPLAEPGRLIPVDSEHSAIFQCLRGEDPSEVHRIWLTCSGGPFYGMTRHYLKRVTAEDALDHPTWSMGDKISIDSATLMNKGLEVIEASQLFGVPIDSIRVLIQRQSRIHSMVEFADGSVKAQLGVSDMRIPIQYALSYPERWSSPVRRRTNWCSESPITFGEADEDTFGCLNLAKVAGRAGGTMPCALNAANEVANQAFREGRCGFLDIQRIVADVMDATAIESVESIEQLSEIDARSRALAKGVLREVAR